MEGQERAVGNQWKIKKRPGFTSAKRPVPRSWRGTASTGRGHCCQRRDGGKRRPRRNAIEADKGGRAGGRAGERGSSVLDAPSPWPWLSSAAGRHPPAEPSAAVPPPPLPTTPRPTYPQRCTASLASKPSPKSPPKPQTNLSAWVFRVSWHASLEFRAADAPAGASAPQAGSSPSVAGSRSRPRPPPLPAHSRPRTPPAAPRQPSPPSGSAAWPRTAPACATPRALHQLM